ncbi:septum formation protein [Escherichia coli]|nr:septum formation protein [Escherichia coli]
MEIASNKGVIADASTPAGRAGMSESEWREAIKFDSTDTGWVIMSIGMAIGAGIVFLPVQVGLMGLWVFFALIGDWLPGNVSVSAVVY